MTNLLIWGPVSNLELKKVGAKKTALLSGTVTSEEANSLSFPFKAWGVQAESIFNSLKENDNVVIVGRLKMDGFREKEVLTIDVIDIRLAK